MLNLTKVQCGCFI